MSVLNEATRRQLEAARPDASTWLSANAGSGKTRVLTDRVARLLLEGVTPQHILCLTYTKAAASEMQNRLFKRLGAWAMLPDVDLVKSLRELGVTHDLRESALRQARTLFASAIETPGGLKIQTIHSFCAALLRRFPLEAEVSPQFTEIEDRAAELLRAEIVDQMAQGPQADAVRALAAHYKGEDFNKLTREIVGQRIAFAHPMTLSQTRDHFGVPIGQSMSTIADSVFLGGEDTLIETLIPALIAKGGLDEKAGVRLAQIGRFDASALSVLEGVFLTGPQAKSPFSAKIDGFPTKDTRKVVADLMPSLEALMLRVEAARESRLALAAAEKTYALHQFAAPFVKLYEEAKQQRGWLDFDDLINKARALLHDSRVAAWVLFRIDGGIDHILVDEAQDTSPSQWDVVRKLTEEFASGEGARKNTMRTVFVVGDTKQSIYSFQGADPREFHRMQTEFKDRITAAGQFFQSLTLDYSFRSSPAILRLVDQCFDPAIRPTFGQQAQHIAFKSDLPGRVDLWPLIMPEKKPKEEIWYDPVDRLSPTHHHKILADKVATHIADLIAHETIPDEVGEDKTLVRRAIRPGDFLILVQRRSTLFADIIRACKARGLSIAGADRLKVGGEMAVKDLAALLSFLATPEDSLSLAVALRSPLFGWSERAVFDLAHHRSQEHLWPALRDRGDEFPETLRVLQDLRDNVDFLRPYDLIERVLTRHDGRRKLLGRLGSEAEDGIDAMLSQALAFERSSVPSLTGFLVWMKTDALEIKRQVDSASDQIRVMTVHGAKGLEAPIVILPDTAQRKVEVKDEIVEMDSALIWRPRSAETPRAVNTALDELKVDIIEERLRLLYVALTRAEKWLIIAGAGDLGKRGDSWYEIAQTALKQMNATDVVTSVGSFKRFSHSDWSAPPLWRAETVSQSTQTLEDVFQLSAERPDDTAKTLSPSDLGGAKALAGDAGTNEEDAMSYGSAVHILLERMIGREPQTWDSIAVSCRTEFAVMPDHMWLAAFSEAKSVLTSPNVADAFAAHGLSEVPITTLLGQHRLNGVIDRLLVTPTRVLAIDYKTNRVIPDRPERCPDGLLRQMGAYAHALAQVYPGAQIVVAILWTCQPQLMVLPHDLVTDALADAGYLDAHAAAT